MFTLLVVSALLLASQSTKPALPLVCITTSDEGDASDVKGRQESVKDSAGRLASKKKDLVVVDEKDRADFAR